MAYRCVHNESLECDGCGECQSESKLYCPVCGKRVDDYSDIFINKETDEVIGCENCVKTGTAIDYDYKLL